MKDQQKGSETTGLSDELHSLRDELKQVNENVGRLTVPPAPEPEAQGNPELDHAFALVCSLSGIEIHEIEYTDTEAIYRCSQAGKYGGMYCPIHVIIRLTFAELRYTLTVSLEEINEASYEITYCPNEDKFNDVVLAKLPDYFAEPLSFMSDAVSWYLQFFWNQPTLTYSGYSVFLEDIAGTP